MPEVRVDVYANTHGAPAELKKTETALDGVEGGGKRAHSTLDKLWKQFAVGNIAADAIRKGLSFLKNELLSTITSAMESEDSQRALASALETTGRNVQAMLPGLTAYASEIQKDTIYTDEQALSVMTLLAQLTDLDEKGLKRAANGALGMATVLKMDLDTATRGITQAMEGNYNLIGRYLPQLRTLKTEEEKHALVMQTLDTWYKRAKDETETFRGSLKQLGNMWDEIKEAVGRAVTENEAVKELIAKIKAGIVDLIESGKLEEWVEDIAKGVTALVKTFEALYKGIKTIVDLVQKLPTPGGAMDKFYRDQMKYLEKLSAEGKARAEEFRDSLKVLDIPLEHLREEMERGEKNWERYTSEMRELDNVMAANRGTAELWVKKIIDFLDIGEKASEKVSDITAAIKAFKQETGVTVTTQDELRDRLAKLTTFWETYGKTLPTSEQNKIKKAIQETKEQLYGVPTKIEIVDEFKRAAPITEELRRKIDELCRSYEFTLPPARDLMDIVRRAPAEFHDTAVGAWDFEGALAAIADQAMVSENTVLQFLWNIRAEFLAMMGIIIPKWPEFSATAGVATAETKNYFDGLYNDIAAGFGQTFSDFATEVGNAMNFAKGEFFKHGIDFKKFFNAIFADIKDAFFRMVGEMVSDKVIGLFKSLFEDIFDIGKKTMEEAGKSAVGAVTDITSGASGAISGMWLGLGAAVGSFLGTVLGNILGGGPSGHQQQQQINDTKDIRNRIQDVYNWLMSIGLNIERHIVGLHNERMDAIFAKFDALRDGIMAEQRDILKTIAENTKGLKELKSAQAGFEGMVARPTLFLTHPGELLRITPPGRATEAAAMAAAPAALNLEVHVHNKPAIIKRDDGWVIEYVNEKIEFVEREYKLGNRRLPVTSIGGAS